MPVLKTHKVYYLIDDEGEICYVGRSYNPLGRWRIHLRRLKENFELLIAGEFEVFEEAQLEELYQIQRLSPRLNTYLSSSPARLGRRNTSSHNLIISKRMSGKSTEVASKAGKKSWEFRSREPGTGPMNGRRHSEETINKLRAAAKLRSLAGENPFKGRHHTEASKAAIRASLIVYNANKGVFK